MPQFYKSDYDDAKGIAERVNATLLELTLPPTPEIYELWYVYHAELNPDVVHDINALRAKSPHISLDACQSIYAKYLSQDKTDAAIKRAGEQIQETIREVNQAVTDVQTRTQSYSKNLGSVVQKVQSTDDPHMIRSVLATLVKDTTAMLETSGRLHEELDKSARVIHELQRDLEIVKREAMTDGLTGLSNRKAFDQQMKRAIADARSTGHAFTLLMIDIDHFKSFNDNYGHQIGDQVLRLVGRTLVDGIKGRDFAARYGGEEFSIILPESNILAGMAVGNALRKAIAMKEIMNRSTGEKLGRVTMSVGVAEFVASESADELIERADSALYTAKHNGRNQVAAAPAPGARVA